MIMKLKRMLTRALKKKIELPGMTCLIIGAGGAAKAIGFMLKEQDVAVSIVNRSRKRGEALAVSLGCPFVPLDEIRGAKGDILVQTTPGRSVSSHRPMSDSRKYLRAGDGSDGHRLSSP